MKLPEWLKDLIDRNRLIAEVDKEITPIKRNGDYGFDTCERSFEGCSIVDDNKNQLDDELKNDQENDQINNKNILEDDNMGNKKLMNFAANLKGLNVEDLFVKSDRRINADINDTKSCDCECGGDCKCNDDNNKCCGGDCKCHDKVYFFKTIEDRDTMPDMQKYVGMVVFVEETNSKYQFANANGVKAWITLEDDSKNESVISYDVPQYTKDDNEEAVSEALDYILEKIDFIKYKLYNQGKCSYCGGYFMYDLSDPQLDLLKLLGFELPEDAKICHCGMDTKIKVKNKKDTDGDEIVDDAMSFTQQYPVNTEVSDTTVSNEDDSVEILWACEEGVEAPHKNEEDLGYDVKAHFDTDQWVIPPHTTSLIPTGLYAAVPVRWGLIAKEKGSTGAIGMKCGAGVIDSGYRDEIFIAITNENDSYLIITKDPEVKKVTHGSYEFRECSCDAIYYPYKKGIAQLLLVPNPKSKGKKISIEELKAIPSIRGEGKLGSTDNF